jgi:tetratricopeptide (TPR) repeat protein
MHGVSGSGKSSCAARLAEELGAIRIRSDVERKRLHGYAADANSQSGIKSGIYTEDAGRRTYERLAEMAACIVDGGFIAIVDATFLEQVWRSRFQRLAEALVEEGKQDSAIAVIDRCNEIVPHEIVPYEFFALELARTYLLAGAIDKARQMIERAFETYDEELGYFFALDKKLLASASVREEIQKNMFYMQRMASLTTENGITDLAEKINTTMQEHFQRYSGS